MNQRRPGIFALIAKNAPHMTNISVLNSDPTRIYTPNWICEWALQVVQIVYNVLVLS